MSDDRDSKRCMIFRCPTGCGTVTMVADNEARVLLDALDDIASYLKHGVSPEIVTFGEYKAMSSFQCTCPKIDPLAGLKKGQADDVTLMVNLGILPLFYDVKFDCLFRGDKLNVDIAGILGPSAEDAIMSVCKHLTGMSHFYKSDNLPEKIYFGDDFDDDSIGDFVFWDDAGEEMVLSIESDTLEELATPVSYTRRLELAGMPTLPLEVSP